MIRMMKTIAPMIRSPPPTNSPKVITTFPEVPVFRINLVEDTFIAIRKMVVNKRMVGKYDISSTSLMNMQANRIVKAIAIFNAMNTSSMPAGSGTMNIMNATST